jgi:GT2 family glycosyltransferase
MQAIRILDAASDRLASLKPIRTQLARWARQGITKWEHEGTVGAIASAFRKLTRHFRREVVGYEQWIAGNEPDEVELGCQCATRFANEPQISLVATVDITPVAVLEACIQSVAAQTYRNWEFLIEVESPAAPRVRELLNSWMEADSRIVVQFLADDRTGADAKRASLSQAKGEFVAFLGADDLLAPFALHEIVAAINRLPDADFLYSDDDKIDPATGQRCQPHFKPDWSPDLLRSWNYIQHLVVMRRSLLDQVGGLRPGFEGAHDYDLILRSTEQAQRIAHIPQVLYHSRNRDADIDGSVSETAMADESSRQALREHLARCELSGTVRHGKQPGYYHVAYDLPRRPLVSIVIPNRDQAETLRRCLDSLWLTDYDHREVVIVENGSRDPRTFAYYDQLRKLANVKIVEFSGQFNYSAVVNLGVRESSGEVVVQLNNDTQAINFDWLERMLEHALRPEIGAVGAKLYYPDGDRIQHAGAVVGLRGAVGHVHLGEPGAAFGYAGRLVTIQNCSVVTGACLMTRRDVFEEVGGLDEQFPLDCNDADFCLKIIECGYRNLWTPLAELYHYESLTRGAAPTGQRLALFQQAVSRFRAKWATAFNAGDPYYNPNLSLTGSGCELRPDTRHVSSRAA